MRELMSGHGRSRRTVVVEKLGINLVVTLEIFHSDEKRCDIDNILKASAYAREDIPYVFDDGTRLIANFEMSYTCVVNYNARESVVRTSRTRSGNKQEVPCSLDVRVRPARRRFPCHYIARFCCHSLIQMLLGSE